MCKNKLDILPWYFDNKQNKNHVHPNDKKPLKDDL